MRLGCFFFVSLRASRFASVGHVVDEDTHTFGFPQIPNVIEKTVKQPTRGARADAARDARFVFSSFSGFALPRRARQKNANREPRRKTKPRKRVEASLASLVVPRAERRQLELILRNQQKSAAKADQGFGGV